MQHDPDVDTSSPPPASGPRDPDAELPPGAHVGDRDRSERGDVDRRAPYAESDAEAGPIQDGD